MTEVATPWLPGWRIIDVANRTPPHPRRFHAALSADGTLRLVTGLPQEFSAMTGAAHPEVGSATVAVAVAATYLDTTQDFVRASYRVTARSPTRPRRRTTRYRRLAPTERPALSPQKSAQLRAWLSADRSRLRCIVT